MKKLISFLMCLILSASPAMAGFQIEDGHGTGNRAKIDGLGRLSSLSVIETEFEHESEKNGLSFTWSNVSYNYDAGDTILLVQSTSDKEFFLHEITLSADVSTPYVVHRITGATTPVGTAVTGINANSKSGNVAEAVAKGDETANSTQGDVVCHGILTSSATLRLPFEGGIILGNTDAIAVDFTDAGTNAYVTILGYYKEAIGN